MNMYEIDKEIEELIESSVDEETGEVVDNSKKLEALIMERSAKLEGCGCAYKKHMYNAKALKDEIGELQKRYDREIKRATGALNFLEYHLHGETFETPKLLVKYGKSTTTEVDNDFVSWAKEHRPDLLRVKPAPEPEADKTAIGNAIKAGETFEHAWREDHVRIKVS